MRLQAKYKKELQPLIKKELGIKNINSVPKIKSVVINVGVGRHSKEKDFTETVKRNLAKISGQAAVSTKAKKAISAFKTRKGMVIGVKVTMRGARMYDFVEKLVNVTLPRVRDFRGLDDKIVDNGGNLTLGMKEQLPFPEIRAEEADTIHGLEICIATSAKKREEGLVLFKAIGFPFKKV
jgi:large subunit ribosomal protein L5